MISLEEKLGVRKRIQICESPALITRQDKSLELYFTIYRNSEVSFAIYFFLGMALFVSLY